MKVFLTGITGLLGNNVARLLTARGDELVALVRSEPRPEVLEGISATLVRGELADAAVIESAVASCDAVIHSAALIHIGWTRMEESLRINRDGTAVIAEAALKHAKRMVHVGTVNTLPLATAGTPADEDTKFTKANSQVPCAYVASKIASVQEVTSRVPGGLDAVIVHPGFILGPYDWKPSSGRMMLELGRGFKPIWPVGGASVCDGRDVAAGVIAAMDRGVTGRHYILAGENMTYRALWGEMAIRMGKPKPLFPIRRGIRAIASAVGDAKTKVTGHETDINSAGIKMSSQLHWYSSDRARKELGYVNRGVNETLDDCAAWIKSHFT